jgi:hypothetical protein
MKSSSLYRVRSISVLYFRHTHDDPRELLARRELGCDAALKLSMVSSRELEPRARRHEVVDRVVGGIFRLGPDCATSDGLSGDRTVPLPVALSAVGPCWCDTRLGLSNASDEHERAGFWDAIIIGYMVHGIGLIRQGHDGGQAVPTDAPAGVPLSRKVFEQDGVSRAEPPSGPIADHDLHLASGEEDGVLPTRRIVPIAETAVGRTREGDAAGGLLG